jgi:DNA-binding response OmpR family regulator
MREAQNQGATGARPKLLCIDDDPEVSRVLALRFEQHGVDVVRAFYGMHGFWLAMTEKPDVIITDIHMPQGRGDFIIECLRNNSDTMEIPVLVLTGRRDSSMREHLRRLGVEGYFVKPAEVERLIEAVGRFVTLSAPAACAPGVHVSK